MQANYMIANRLVVLHVVPDLRHLAGGIAGIIPDLCKALGEEGVESRVLSFALPTGIPSFSGTLVTCDRSPWRLKATIANEVERAQARASGEGRNVVCHSHGLWSLLNHTAVEVARAKMLPLVISLHGMLLPWARQHRAFRKSVAWRIYQAQDLVGANLVHATSDDECAAAVNAGVTTPISVAPFGVALPPVGEPTHDRRSQRTILFLGRVHPIKNLPSLIQAFAEIHPEQWRLLIVGPDESGHRDELKRLAAQLGISDRVCFEGPVVGEAKRELFDRVHLLALPSHSENYGLVAAEALAHGVPVLASTGTPWGVLERECCGWWVRPDRNDIACALRSIFCMDESTLREMGSRGRAYVKDNLTWNAAAKRMVTVYQKAIDAKAIHQVLE